MRNRAPPREITRFLLSSVGEQQTDNSAIMMQWGQFIGHDMARTTQLNNAECQSCNFQSFNCANLQVTPSDQRYVHTRMHSAHTRVCRFGTQACLPVARSTPVCGSTQNIREQFNENSAFIDGSQVYGSSFNDLPRFRQGNTGFMQTSFLVGHTGMCTPC